MKVVHYVAERETTVRAILAELSEGEDAVAEGRVFVGKVRATSVAVEVGRGVLVAVTRRPDAAPTDVCILHRSPGILVVEKPTGIPTIADGRSKSHSLVSAAARAADLPVEALHPTSRLDRDVSGVVTFATNAEARQELAAARARGDYERRYVAIAVRAPTPSQGICDAALGPAKDPRFRRIDPRGEPAQSRFATVASLGEGRPALLALGPVTGRTHQLRVHASHLGAPLLGDKTYGGPIRLTLPSGKSLGFSRVFLHCAKVRIVVRGDPLELAADVPSELRETWAALGGAPDGWDRALAWDTLPRA